MSKMTMALPQARLELALWQAQADTVNSSDLYVRLTDMGLPSEVAIRLKSLLDLVKRVGDKVVSLGKIIVMKLIEFIEQHPHLTSGIALGAALSALIGSVPFLGPILAPVALPLGIIIGATTGHRVDKAQGKNINTDASYFSVAQDVIEVAQVFFKLFIEIMSAVAADFS